MVEEVEVTARGMQACRECRKERRARHAREVVVCSSNHEGRSGQNSNPGV